MAPNSAYSNKNLQVVKNGSIVYHNIALPNTDINTIKSRFYLDYVLNTSAGFVGCCYVGGNNYNHHASGRVGVINMFKGGTLKAYLDGGLNTLPNVVNVNPVSKQIGNLQVQMMVQSAYYVNTDSWGIQYIDKSTGQWALADSLTDAVAQGTSATRTTNSHSFGSNTNQYTSRQNVTVRGFATNAEGTWFTDAIAFTVESAPIVLKYNASYASYAVTSSQSITIQLESYPFFGTGTRFKNVGVGDTVPAGYYYYPATNEWMYFVMDSTDSTYNVISSRGQAVDGQYPAGDPSNTANYATIPYNRFGTSLSDTCGFAGGNNNNNLYSPLTGANSNKYYSNNGLSVLASNGYYITINAGTGAKTYMYLIDGIRQSQGTCSTNGGGVD